jgi:hypothetical protein
MHNQLDFMVYCIENYKNANHLSGAEAVALFNKYRVFDYIKASYEALHTTGKDYIVDDITIYINARKRAGSAEDLFEILESEAKAKQIPPVNAYEVREEIEDDRLRELGYTHQNH